MADYCRIKIVGNDLQELGLIQYQALLTETNSFILDLTNQINNQKSAHITEYPTFPDGRKRIAQVVPEPESLTIDGALSKYGTVRERQVVDVALFRQFLETLVENAVLLDVETETKSYYNYVIQSLNVGQEGIGTVKVNLTLREIWLISAAEELKVVTNPITENGELNDVIKEQSLKTSMSIIHDNLLRAASKNPYKEFGISNSKVVHDFFADFAEQVMTLGKESGESIFQEFKKIKVDAYKEYDGIYLKNKTHMVDNFMDPGIVERVSNGFDEFWNRLIFNKYPSLKESFQSIDYSNESIKGLKVNLNINTRKLYTGDDAEFINQFTYHKHNAASIPNNYARDHCKLQNFKLNYTYAGPSNTVFSGTSLSDLTWNKWQYLTASKNRANSPFRIIENLNKSSQCAVTINTKMGTTNLMAGLMYLSYFYEVEPGFTDLTKDSSGNNYIIIRYNYFSARLLKLMAQVIIEAAQTHGTVYPLSQNLRQFAEKDSD